LIPAALPRVDYLQRGVATAGPVNMTAFEGVETVAHFSDVINAAPYAASINVGARGFRGFNYIGHVTKSRV